AGRREIDRDFVGETILRHDPYDTDRGGGCQGCVSVSNALCRRSKSAHSAADRCSCMKRRARRRFFLAQRQPFRRAASGSAPIAITLKKPERMTEAVAPR